MPIFFLLFVACVKSFFNEGLYHQTVWPNQSIERRFQLVNISFLLDSFEKAQGTPEERHFHKAPSDFSYHVKRHTLNKSTENHKDKHIRIISSKAFFSEKKSQLF